ncbi:thioredoxin domain-containing protein 11 [Melanaphis sacchari]|uniref:Thioredoxin domain-containing protein 11 n=1 Tax=Melanaphis sacchari TaxID=742174 RepID=A0A2H8TMG2_9HEMI|nr:thioredoxin domain-containing protein 11 [Melanaphis sacchari]
MKTVVEEEAIKEQPGEARRQPLNWYKQLKMFIKGLGKELLFALFVTCTTYATIINIQNDYGIKYPKPKPFFPANSCVKDFYTGNLKAVLEKATVSDIAVVMFYAPWDADSIDSQEAFIEACENNKEEVYFAAINCWQPESVCSKVLKGNKVYPMIVAYDYTKVGIYYTGPPNDAAYITRFIDNMKRPVKLLNNKLDLLKVHQQYHSVLVASVDFKITQGWDLYKIVLDAAINHLKTDPLQMYVKWCVATWPLSSKEPLIKLLLWNYTLAFNESFVNHETLGKWVIQETRLTTQWVPSIARSRSLILDNSFKSGPTMLLFTPHNPYLDFNPIYSMLQLLSIEYFNCQKVSIPASYITKYLIKEIKSFYNKRPAYVKQCQEIIMNKYPDKMASILKKHNATIKVENQDNFNFDTSTEVNYFNKALCKMSKSIFFDHKISYCSNDLDKSSKKIAKINLSNHMSTENFVEQLKETKCYRNLLANKYFRFSRPDEAFIYNTTDALRSACLVNKSMTFLALDSNHHYHTAKVFGINLNHYREKTAVVIYDMKSEMVHTLPKSSHVTKDTMAKLLIDFLENRAKRHLRSSADLDINFHLYQGKGEDKETIYIKTLNSETFNDAVFNNTDNVVVYFYTPFCAYCQVVAHVLLSVARLMRNVKDLKFFRFNASDNDLSWHLTVQTYPSIIIFPAKKKAESYVFPYNTELTSNNLSQFILSNLLLETRLQAMVGLCSVWNSSEDYNKQLHYCLRDIKLDCDANISKSLQSYRRGLVYREKNKNITLTPIFNRLRYLKAFSLILDVTHKLNAKSIQKFSEIYNF